MVYPYRCECGVYIEAWKPVSECARPEYCPACNKQMIRIFTVPRVAVVQSGYYHQGLGIAVNKASDLKEHIKRENDRNGTDLQPLEPGMTRKRKEGIHLSDNEISEICHRIDAPEEAHA